MYVDIVCCVMAKLNTVTETVKINVSIDALIAKLLSKRVLF